MLFRWLFLLLLFLLSLLMLLFCGSCWISFFPGNLGPFFFWVFLVGHKILVRYWCFSRCCFCCSWCSVVGWGLLRARSGQVTRPGKRPPTLNDPCRLRCVGQLKSPLFQCRYWRRSPRVPSPPPFLFEWFLLRCHTRSCRQWGRLHFIAIGRCTRLLWFVFALSILVEAGSISLICYCLPALSPALLKAAEYPMWQNLAGKIAGIGCLRISAVHRKLLSLNQSVSWSLDLI